MTVDDKRDFQLQSLGQISKQKGNYNCIEIKCILKSKQIIKNINNFEIPNFRYLTNLKYVYC